jgi:hypothetical protein
MKRSIKSLLVVGLCAGTATLALTQNVTVDGKPGAASEAPDQNETTNPSERVQATSRTKGKHRQDAGAFKTADNDNDATLDQAQAKAIPRVAKTHRAIDATQDGTVPLDEVYHLYGSPAQSYQELGLTTLGPGRERGVHLEHRSLDNPDVGLRARWQLSDKPSLSQERP